MSIDALHCAIRDGDTDTVETLISADPHLLGTYSAQGWTPLIVASFHGRAEIMRFLLANGADPNVPNPKGTTPLMYAKGHYLRTGDAQPLHLLLDAGADPHVADAAGLPLIDYVPEERRADVGAIIFGRRNLAKS